MKTPSSRLLKNVTAFAGFILLGVVGLSISASAGLTAPSDGQSHSQLKQELGAGARVAYDSETGMVQFIGSAPGKPISRPSGLAPSASPTAVARAFLGSHGKAFGIGDQAKELRVMSARAVSAGRSVVRFQQNHEGVPVLGGELVVNLDGSKNVLSAGGEVLPAPAVSVLPRIESSAASDTALTAVAKARSVPASKLQASKPSLWIYDSRILGGPGLAKPTLVWRMDVTGEGGPEPIDELVLVDAQLGVVALQFDQLEKALYRQVCDANNADAQVPCTTPVRSEGEGTVVTPPDVNDAYDHSGETYNFFFDHFGRDSIDGSGMTLKSTTRYCNPSYACPYANAYWNGEQMVYGQGFASADDVVGHELTHGITDYTSNLFYYYQSGAINESLSDIFGEFVDQTNGRGTDTPAAKWKLGEDLSSGAIRSMADPTVYSDPDKMSSTYYAASPHGNTDWDNGGVHTNSGIDNKAAYLITDGGTFNGYTITGLGIDKAAAIYYEVGTNLLTSGSDYGDLYYDLPQACTNLIGADIYGSAVISSADCTQVTNAVKAVEMNGTPAAVPNPEAPICPTGELANNLLLDDFENSANGLWAPWTGLGENYWYYDTTYATSGATDLWGYDYSDTADYAAQMTSSVLLPAGSASFLRFNHAYQFENSGPVGWDGGVLEYSTDGGANWHDAASLGIDNGYNGTINATFGNPLAGRSAFIAESNGYISSRANLASLAGQNVRFRFRIGTDSVGDEYGWFVDDVRVYACGALANDPPTADAGDSYTISEGESLQLNGSATDPEGDTLAYAWDLNSDGDFTDASGASPAVSWGTLAGFGVDGPSDVAVRLQATDSHGAVAWSEATLTVINAPPTASVTGPSTATAGHSSTWTFSATDPSPQDQAGSFTYKIDWNGDGVRDQTVSGSSSLAVSHNFSSAGAVTIKATATDNDGGESGQVTLGVTVAAPRTISFSAASYSVGEGDGPASITIKRSGSTAAADSIHFATTDGSARAGSNYTSVSQDLSFGAGETSKTVSVPVIDDGRVNDDQTVSLSLSNPSSGASRVSPYSATLTIRNNDANVSLGPPVYSVKESAGPAVLSVGRAGYIGGTASVHVATTDGTASAGKDYAAISQTVTFAPNENLKTVSIPIVSDKRLEPNETLKVAISGPSANSYIVSKPATITIVNSPGKIASAKLAKSLKISQTRTAKLVLKFSPESKRFNYLLSLKKGGKWVTVRSVRRSGRFATAKPTVKSLFGKKAILGGAYRLKLSADANSKTLSFKVT